MFRGKKQTRTLWILIKDSVDAEWDGETKERIEEPSVWRDVAEEEPCEEDACVDDTVCNEMHLEVLPWPLQADVIVQCDAEDAHAEDVDEPRPLCDKDADERPHAERGHAEHAHGDQVDLERDRLFCVVQHIVGQKHPDGVVTQSKDKKRTQNIE